MLITLVPCIGLKRKFHHWKAEIILHLILSFMLSLEILLIDKNVIFDDNKLMEISND